MGGGPIEALESVYTTKKNKRKTKVSMTFPVKGEGA